METLDRRPTELKEIIVKYASWDSKYTQKYKKRLLVEFSITSNPQRVKGKRLRGHQILIPPLFWFVLQRKCNKQVFKHPWVRNPGTVHSQNSWLFNLTSRWCSWRSAESEHGLSPSVSGRPAWWGPTTSRCTACSWRSAAPASGAVGSAKGRAIIMQRALKMLEFYFLFYIKSQCFVIFSSRMTP